jgi:Cys-rich protein (TIGR01571 family)
MQRVFWALSEGAVASVLLTAGENTSDSLKALQTVSLIGAIPFTFVLLGEVLATYKTFQIHLGELDVTKLVYWKYDIIEAFYQDMTTFCIATVCPPWVQYQARMKMVEHNERRKETSDYDPSYAAGAFQWVWVVGYFALYLMVIIFGLLEFAESGFKYLALAMHMFWVALAVGNRSLMKSYYGIDSSNIMFDLLSWSFCWCYAGTQEVLQAREGEVVRDLKVADTATPAKPVVDQKIELASAGDEAAPASDYVQ